MIRIIPGSDMRIRPSFTKLGFVSITCIGFAIVILKPEYPSFDLFVNVDTALNNTH